jgi:hypothetical protein
MLFAVLAHFQIAGEIYDLTNLSGDRRIGIGLAVDARADSRRTSPNVAIGAEYDPFSTVI